MSPDSRKDDFIVSFVAFGAQNGVANLSLDLLLRGRGKYPLPARSDAGAFSNVPPEAR